MPFNIIRSDITKVSVDAIVNAANHSLLGGGGVDGAIHRAAGPKLLDECKKLGGCLTGNAKITQGYKLPCKYIIHTVGPVWQGGNNNEETLLNACYQNSLELAKKYRCKSIAFPLISSGAYGYPKTEALNVAKRVITNFLKNNEMDITLVLFETNSVKLSEEIVEQIDQYVIEHHYRQYQPTFAMFAGTVLKNSTDKKKRQSFRYASDFPANYSLENRLKHRDVSFSQKLMQLIDESGMKDSEVYKAANISKQAFSKIRANKKYHPKKNTVLAFSIALKLNLYETEELLMTAGYALSNSEITDIIVAYHIEKGIYDIYDINIVLFEYEQPLLRNV